MPQSPLAMVNDFVSALLEQIETLDSQILDELAKRDTQISIRDTEIANLRATIVELGSRLNLAQLELSKRDTAIAIREQQLIDNAAQILVLEVTIKQCETEIERLKSLLPVEPPQRPPVEVSPDITISLDGIGSFRPSLRGERQGQEIRYAGNLNNDVRVICDIKDDGQIRTTAERCYSDLPFTAPPLQTVITVKIPTGLQRNLAEISQGLRLHHHTRPALVLNSSPAPKVNLSALITAKLIPNYANAIRPSEADLEKIRIGQHPWTRLPNPLIYSEDYGQIIDSWTGGAGPLLNEAGHLMPVQVVYLLTQDPRAWAEVVRLANSSGNYAIHYKVRDDRGGHWPTPAETANLPFLNQTGPVTLKAANGTTLPIPEVAHQHSLTYLAYLLTGERYYREELEAWCVFNLLTRPKNDDRLVGIIHSGQERATAWALRALLHRFLSCFVAGPFAGIDSIRYVDKSSAEIAKRDLVANLNWLNSTFVNPQSPNHRATGVLSIHDFRAAPLLAYVTAEPKPSYFSTWNHHVLASVLNECARSGFTEAVPIRNHVLKVIRGVWEHSLSPYHVGWGNHAYNLDSWADIIRTTFQGATFTNPPRDTFPSITTPEYIAWARSAVVADVDAGEPRASSALDWIDAKAPSYKGGIPLVWQINPRSKETTG